MEIANVTALLKQHVYEQSLDATQATTDQDDPVADDDLDGPSHVSETTAPRPWTVREPYSPPTMGLSLPYLDVMTVQSKRLLPLSRKELDAQRRQMLISRRYQVRSAIDGDESDPDEGSTPEDTREEEADAEDHTPELTDGEMSLDAIVRSARLLMEPMVLPDLAHTGVKWQLAQGPSPSDDTPPQFCVTVPNHSFDETQTKLFYPTGAKNANMRDYIKDTIQRHMAGFLANSDDALGGSPSTSLTGCESAPTLHAATGVNLLAASPAHKKAKAKQKGGGTSSPAKGSSPQKRVGHAISSGARLAGSVSTSGLLNPELTRQTKDILAQLRTNANKINDLIGS